MVNALVKYITPKTKTPTIPILSPGEPTNPLMKYITPEKKTTDTIDTTMTTPSTNPLLKYINKPITTTPTTTQKPQEYDIMKPKGYEWMTTPAEAGTEPFKLSTLAKRVLKDLMASVPMIGAGFVQWPVQAHRQTISEGMKFPTPSGEKTVISPKYTQPQGIGYIPAMLFNMIFKPGIETIEQLTKPKELLASYYQHPVLGPLGSAVSLALPLMVAKGAMPRARAYPLAAKEGLMPGPFVPTEPSLPSKLVRKAYEKFKESPRMLRFKELTGLLPEQIDYFNLRYNYELQRADMMSKAGRSELYNVLQSINPAEKQSFILNLEIAKPATAESLALLKKAKITIPEPTINVAKALDLWKASSEEGLTYMMKATEGTLYKGGARGKLLTQSALARGRAEFKVPLIEKAKEFRAEVKKLGGISEESIKAYEGIIPKDLIAKAKSLKASKATKAFIKAEIDSIDLRISKIVENKIAKEAKVQLGPKEFYLNKLKDIESYITDSGGIKYTKAMADEYKRLPFKLKARKGYATASALDEMAMDIGNAFPEHGIKTGSDLIRVLKDLRVKSKTGYTETYNVPTTEAFEDIFLQDYQRQSNISGFKGIFEKDSISDLVFRKGELESQLIEIPGVTKGLSVQEIATRFKMAPDEVISKLRKYSEMKSEFTDLAVGKMTKKFGYKVPIGTKPGEPRGGFVEEARWQPTVQALEAKLGTKFTIAELKDLGFQEPSYYHHAFPRDYQFRTRAYTGPSYSPGIWKERMGAEGYTREPLTSVKSYDYQIIKYKALNEFKDYVFDKFGKRLNPENPMQAIEIRKGNLTKYGKGKVLYETPEGAQIKIKADAVLPRTIANEFNNMFTKTGRGEMFFRTYFDPITNAWRIPVLALSPRWVFNNICGNFILNTMGGVGVGGYLDSIGASVKAAKMMVEAKKAGRPITYVDALIKVGVPERVAQGLYRGELMGVQEGLPITGAQKATAVAKYIPNKVYRFNSTVESFFRTAHYLDKVGKGFDIKAATASVNEFLFDYGGLSPMQKAIFRRIDPFWNWHKNIIRLAVSYPIKYPQRYLFLSFANKIGTEAYDDKLRAAGVNPDNIPEYYKNMFLLPWKDKDGKDFYISMRGIDPLQDIEPKLSMLHPLIQLVLERALGVNTFTGKPFTSPYTLYGKYEKVTPPMWRSILNKFPQFRLIEDEVRPYSIYDTGEPMLTKWGEPVYTKNRLLAVLAILGFKVTPREIDEIYRRSIEEERAKEKRKTKYEQSLELFKGR